MNKTVRRCIIAILAMLVVVEFVLFVMNQSLFNKILAACVLTAIGAFIASISFLMGLKEQKHGKVEK
ncbi:MAG: hypothetical protein J5531_02690 [Lachnospiraceae bacterium]|nr:hypothetical protein [Lachnospiraceae bacterium]